MNLQVLTPIAACLTGMTVEDMSDRDLSYNTPPLSSPWDLVQIAAQAGSMPGARSGVAHEYPM